MLLALFASILSAIFATAILGYITLATSIGPWIESTVLLMGILIVYIVRKCYPVSDHVLGYSTAAGGVAGIMATAFGFSFPTMFFLDKSLLMWYLAHPVHFACLTGGLAFAGGLFGYFVAVIYEEQLLKKESMPIPVGQMSAKILQAQHELKSAVQLGVGFCGSLLYSIMQTTYKLFPIKMTLIPAFSYRFISFAGVVIRPDLAPMFLALGFITGHLLVVPLCVGIITKLCLLDPLHTTVFNYVSIENTITAFASGLMLHGALHSVIALPSVIGQAAQKLWKSSGTSSEVVGQIRTLFSLTQLMAGATGIGFFFYYCGFNVIEMIYILIFTYICTYQLLIIGGKIGLAPLGRFATFVMLPALFIFPISPLKVSVLATFVELSGGVAVDILFGKKMAQQTGMSRIKMGMYQLVGIICCALSIGAIMWLLMSHFGLGSAELLAQRSQARVLLINALQFDYYLLIIGMLYGMLLHYIKINPLLVLSGLFMPLELSILLIAGGLTTYLVKEKEDWYPLWSGIFAASSLWMLIRALGF